MTLRRLSAIAAVLILAVVAAYVVTRNDSGGQAAAPRGGPPGGWGAATPVVVTPVVTSEFVDSIEAIGTAKSRESIMVSAKITETVYRVNFTDGQRVEAGAILVELNAEEATAELEEARAAKVEADAQYERVSDLVRRGISTRSNLDTAISARDRAKARLEAIEARISDHLIRAPFDGVLGFRSVSPGTLVRPGDVITTLDDIRVIKVDFSIPETFLGTLSEGLEVNARSAAFPDRTFSGVITAIDTRVDPQNRKVMVRAEIHNQDLALRPGMLMTTEVLKNRRTALSVPEAALMPMLDQVFVFVAKPSERGTTVERKEITVGARRPGIVEVLSGLEAGELVVTDGNHRIRPGASVNVIEEETFPQS